MAIYNFDFLYIGRLAVADIEETDFDNEDSSMFQRIFDQTEMTIAPVTVNDDDNNADLLDDETGTTDTISYNFTGPDGPVSYSGALDSTAFLEGTVTYANGNTATEIFTVIQAPNGDTFVLDVNNVLDNATIQSLEFTTVIADNVSGHIINPDEGLSNSTIAVCFLHGTQIETQTGTRPVETLVPGDLIRTLDHGFQALRWIGHQLHTRPCGQAPFRIARDALGPQCPARTLLVSPNHRIMLGNKVSARMFETEQIFVAAKALASVPGVSQAAGWMPVSYWHLAFDRHEIVRANGAWAESLHPGPMAQQALSQKAWRELQHALGGRMDRPLARPCPSARLQRRFVQRSLVNSHALLPDDMTSGMARCEVC